MSGNNSSSGRMVRHSSWSLRATIVSNVDLPRLERPGRRGHRSGTEQVSGRVHGGRAWEARVIL